MVLLALGSPEVVHSTLMDGVQFGELHLREDESAPDTDELLQYGTLEAVAILHHTSEALLRLILAHEYLPACPWLEIARLRQPGEFPKALKKLRRGLGDQEQQDRIVHVLRGGLTPAEVNVDISEDAWFADRQGLIQLLEAAAERIDSEVQLYNSVKHGLAAIAGAAHLKLGGEESPINVEASGPMVTFMGLKKKTDGSIRWQKTTTWVRVETTIAFSAMLSKQIESLWSVARLRYLGQSGGKIQPVTPDQVQAVTSLGRTGGCTPLC